MPSDSTEWRDKRNDGFKPEARMCRLVAERIQQLIQQQLAARRMVEAEVAAKAAHNATDSALDAILALARDEAVARQAMTTLSRWCTSPSSKPLRSGTRLRH